MNAFDAAKIVHFSNNRSEDKLHAIKPTNGDQDAVVTRDAFAYEIDENGYFRPVLPAWPLLSHKNGGCTHALLSPQRTRLTNRPVSFGHPDFVKTGAVIEGDPSTSFDDFITNGDMSNVTGGMADDWLENDAPNQTSSIVTGNGFTGNAQRVEATGAGYAGIRQVLSGVPLIGIRKVTVKYRCNGALKSNIGSFSPTPIIPTNTGNALEHTFYPHPSDNNFILFVTNVGEWFEVADVKYESVYGFDSPMLEPDLGTAESNGFNSTGNSSVSGATATGFTNNYTSGSVGWAFSNLDGNQTYLTNGVWHKVEFDIVLNSGSYGTNTLEIVNGSTSYGYINSDGHYEVWISTGTNCFLRDTSTSKNYSVSNYTVKKILQSASITPMKKAFKLVEDGTTGYHYIEAPSVNTTGGGYVSTGISAKQDENTKIQLYVSDNITGTLKVNVDLSDGSYQTPIASGDWTNISVVISELVDGYYHIGLTGLEGSSTQIAVRVYLLDDSYNLSYEGTNGNGVKLFFLQEENGSYPTMPMWNGSEGAQLTRVAEKHDISDISSLKNGNKYALLLDVDWGEDTWVRDNAAKQFHFSDTSNDANNSITIYRIGAGIQVPHCILFDDGTLGASSDVELSNKGKVLIRANGDNTYDVFQSGAKLGTINHDIGTDQKFVGFSGYGCETKVNEWEFMPFAPVDADCIALTS